MEALHSDQSGKGTYFINHFINKKKYIDLRREYILVQGPDVYFEEMILEQDGVEYSVIVTSELWSERVMLYYVENIPGAWAKPANIK